MPRSGRLRKFIRGYKESTRFEKMSFIPPFFILFVEGILLIHALTINIPDIMIVELTIILLAISIIEIFFVSVEIHRHYTKNNFDKILTVKLDDFIMQKNVNNVKKIVEDFIEIYPHYSKYRSEIYHTTCQILQIHKERAFEEQLTEKIRRYIKKNKKMNVDEIMSGFIKNYPRYKANADVVYEITCQIKEKE